MRGLADESRTDQSDPQATAPRSCMVFRVQAITYVPRRGRGSRSASTTLERSD
jgi:hypothetical protein